MPTRRVRTAALALAVAALPSLADAQARPAARRTTPAPAPVWSSPADLGAILSLRPIRDPNTGQSGWYRLSYTRSGARPLEFDLQPMAVRDLRAALADAFPLGDATCGQRARVKSGVPVSFNLVSGGDVVDGRLSCDVSLAYLTLPEGRPAPVRFTSAGLLGLARALGVRPNAPNAFSPEPGSGTKFVNFTFEEGPGLSLFNYPDPWTGRPAYRVDLEPAYPNHRRVSMYVLDAPGARALRDLTAGAVDRETLECRPNSRFARGGAVSMRALPGGETVQMALRCAGRMALFTMPPGQHGITGPLSTRASEMSSVWTAADSALAAGR